MKQGKIILRFKLEPDQEGFCLHYQNSLFTFMMSQLMVLSRRVSQYNLVFRKLILVTGYTMDKKEAKLERKCLNFSCAGYFSL